MKPWLLLTLLLVAFLGARSQFSVGIKGGLNMARFHFANPDYGTTLEPGLYAGLTGTVTLNNHWGLRGELVYSQEGTRETLAAGGGSGYTRYDYVNLPLLAQFRTATGFYVEAGPQLGYLLSARETFAGVSDNLQSDTHGAEFSACLGVGYELPAPLPGLGVEGRFTPGFTQLNKVADNGSTIHSQVWSLGLTYNLRR